MSDLLNSLNANKNAYSNLKTNLQNAVSKLNSSKDFLEVSTKISEYYLINNLSADVKSIEDKRNKIINDINTINNTIIPAIDTKIGEISWQITQEEGRIAYEKQQAEEAAKKAQQANSDDIYGTTNTTR